MNTATLSPSAIKSALACASKTNEVLSSITVGQTPSGYHVYATDGRIAMRLVVGNTAEEPKHWTRIPREFAQEAAKAAEKSGCVWVTYASDESGVGTIESPGVKREYKTPGRSITATLANHYLADGWEKPYDKASPTALDAKYFGLLADSAKHLAGKEKKNGTLIPLTITLGDSVQPARIHPTYEQGCQARWVIMPVRTE